MEENLIALNVSRGDYISANNKVPLYSTYDDLLNYSNNNTAHNVNINCAKSKSQDHDNSEKNTENLSGKSYALATLDGTIMLVRNEIILWYALLYLSRKKYQRSLFFS